MREREREAEGELMEHWTYYTRRSEKTLHHTSASSKQVFTWTEQWEFILERSVVSGPEDRKIALERQFNKPVVYKPIHQACLWQKPQILTLEDTLLSCGKWNSCITSRFVVLQLVEIKCSPQQHPVRTKQVGRDGWIQLHVINSRHSMFYVKHYIMMEETQGFGLVWHSGQNIEVCPRHLIQTGWKTLEKWLWHFMTETSAIFIYITNTS